MKNLVVGNWKMNGSPQLALELATAIQGFAQQQVELAILPPFVYLPLVETILSHSAIRWGAQDVSVHEKGAYTGEISAKMLLEFKCRYVLVGHSERRTLHGETDRLIAEKFHRAQQAGLIPILCVGENHDERQSEVTEQVIECQLGAILASEKGVACFKNAVIAYEPVWAIGTGLTATPEQAQDIHRFIREMIAAENAEIAKSLRILYGGSVRPDNAKAIFAMPDINGGLIGGASLDAKQFLEIANLCNS